MHNENLVATNIGKKALGMLKSQSFIPGQLLEERNGELCMCTGAALLYGVHQIRHGNKTTEEFFADRAFMSEDDFVIRECERYALNAETVFDIIISTKALKEAARPSAIAEIVFGRIASMT
jgi:hypothetical protein